jgi:hypothetical protein
MSIGIARPGICRAAGSVLHRRQIVQRGQSDHQREIRRDEYGGGENAASNDRDVASNDSDARSNARFACNICY